jgi:hypothetical protein
VVQGHSFRDVMQVESFGHLLFSDWGDPCIRKILCLLGMINTEEMNSLFSL